jgi:hypothetical protein
MFCDFIMIFYLSRIDVNVPSKSNTQKTQEKFCFFVAILKATDEKSRIRIRTGKSLIRIRGSGTVPKFHGSTTHWP